MTTIVSGSSITFNDNTTQNTSAYGGGFAFRNRIINGDMRIDQRNAGATVATTSSYPVDRFIQEWSGVGVLTSKQSTDAPEGFTNSLEVKVTTIDASISGGDYYQIRQSIEGFNVADIGLGQSWCKPMALSFWVKASQTGTYNAQLANSSGSRCYPATITVNSANTWEYKTINIPATTSGTFATNNSEGLGLRIGFAYGSTYNGATANAWMTTSGFDNSFITSTNNMMATLNATFYITGVQLEKGSTATSFDYRPYGQELALCQRYCPMIGPVVADSFSAVGYTLSTTQGRVIFQFPVTARTAPTGITVTNPTGFALAPPFARTASAVAFSESNTQYASVDVTTTGLTANQPTTLRIGSSGGCKIEFTGCEL